MDGMNYYDGTSAYQQNNVNGESPKKSKNKILGIILLVLGAVLMVLGVGIIFMGNTTSRVETSEPIDVYYAFETEQYVYARTQYMTESVAYFEAMENMMFYMTFDVDWNPAIVCLHVDDLPTYQPYIDWLYSDSYENEPEEMDILGYAQPIDEELEQYIIESFDEHFGEGIVDKTNFVDYFGEYYVQVGQKNSVYGTMNAGIYVLLAAIFCIGMGGADVYRKTKQQPQAEYADGPIVVDSGNRGLGIIGAFIGAALGGILWAVVGILGYVSGWIGILMVVFAYTGYKILAKKEDTFGVVISMVFGCIMIFAGTYLSWGWSYYQMVNEGVTGYTSLWRALLELSAFMSSNDLWADFGTELVMGYVFLFVASLYSFSGVLRRKKNKGNIN